MKTPKEPAGILKFEVMCLSIVWACNSQNEVWLVLTDTMILDFDYGF
jgi:hypothetical protein